MNLLTGIVLIIFVLFMLRGYRKGFISGVASMVSLIVSIALVSLAVPYVTEFLKTETGICDYVENLCEQTFSVDKLIGTQEGTASSSGSQQVSEGLQAQEKQAIERMGLPKALENLLIHNNTTQIYKELAVSTFEEYVPRFMANLILNMISFVLTWILVAIAIRVLVAALNTVASLPVLRSVNHLLGVALGFLQGLMIVWLFFLVITIFSSTGAGRQLLDMISESPVLRTLYDANILLDFLQNAAQNLW